MAVMEAAGSENLRDPSAMAVSPPAGMALSLSSVGMGVSAVMAAAGSSPPNDTVLSLSSETMVVAAEVASADGATLLLTDAMLSSLSSETAAVA